MKSPEALSLLALMLFFELFSTPVVAAQPATAHTFTLEDGEERPAASLEDAGFLVGSWTGTAFGQRFEEVWNPPSAGSMVGMFKLYDGDEVSFYELLVLSIEDGTLSLKVKHFDADFTAWEDRPDYVNFRLVSMAPGELHFSGISFYSRSDRSMDAYIVMRNADGIVEQHLAYQRD